MNKILRKLAWGTIKTFRPYVLCGNSAETFIVHTADTIIGKEIFLRGVFDFAKFEATWELMRSHGTVRPDILINMERISARSAFRR